MSNSEFPKARSKDLVVLTRSNETLVYDITANKAHCLNETAGFVWDQCNGSTSIQQIAASVQKRFGDRVDTGFIMFAISQLDERELLSSSAAGLRPKLSRREAIRNIGRASAVAVPVILSIVAPAHALGTLSCRIACRSPGECFTFPQCGNSCSPSGDCAPPTASA